MEQIALQAVAAYGYPEAVLANAESGYRNTSYSVTTERGLLNLVIFKDEPEILNRITRANQLGDYLHQAGMPARYSMDRRILRLSQPSSTRYAALYKYLPGDTIPWEGYTKHHIKLLGMTMGLLHGHTHSMSHDNYPDIVTESIELLHRVERYMGMPGVTSAMHTKLAVKFTIPSDFESMLRQCQHLSDQRVLHMDLVRSNILFAEANSTQLSDGPVAVTGILDFEKTAYGHPVFDIARTLAFLLVDCKYKAPDKIYKYFLRSGYEKRGQQLIPRITYHGKDVLEQLLVFYLIHDLYKFMRHNPYEYLDLNEHYVRTRDILIKKGILEKL